MKRPLLTSICLFMILFTFVFNAAAAPYKHPKTGVSFPELVGDVSLVKVTDFEKEYPGLGVGISYRADTFKGDVYIYNLSMGQVPAGIAAPVITGQFEQAMGDVYTLEKRGSYKDLVVQIKQETVQVGNFPFLHSMMTYTQDDIKRVSHLYLTGYKGQFLKVRITYFSTDAAKGEKTLAAFINMIGNNLK
ncbi:MAG: hypothetical protein C0392_14685 [Syntrophus sp. (in: bacteria)]|nr:hypothetical protein [Syntrophus sp. (in: bacteria)]